MIKLATSIFALRTLQFCLGIAFIVFWTWSCAAKYVVGGGAGEYFLGYFTSLVSLAICVHGIWSFVRKQHLKDHTALYHNARWAVDLAAVVLWLGIILINILVPISQDDWERQLGGGQSSNSSWTPPSGSDPIVVVGGGVSVTELFSVITFFITALLLIIPAVGARRTGGGTENRAKDEAEDTAVEHGIQAPQAAYVARQSGEEADTSNTGGEERTEGSPVAYGIRAPQAAHVVDI